MQQTTKESSLKDLSAHKSKTSMRIMSKTLLAVVAFPQHNLLKKTEQKNQAFEHEAHPSTLNGLCDFARIKSDEKCQLFVAVLHNRVYWLCCKCRLSSMSTNLPS